MKAARNILASLIMAGGALLVITCHQPGEGLIGFCILAIGAALLFDN